jgi:hypothetical protein
VLETVGAVLAVVVTAFAVVGALWRFVILPNLREQLLRPVEETRRQVMENKHVNRKPTLLDRLDDVEQTLEAIGLNQTALMKQIGDHVGESVADRRHLWLVIEALVHEEQITERKGNVRKHRDHGGA